MQPSGLLRAGALLYARDLKLAFRRWEQLTQPVVFFLMVTTLFPLALSPELSQLRQIAAGVVWVAAALVVDGSRKEVGQVQPFPIDPGAELGGGPAARINVESELLDPCGRLAA